MMIQLTPSRVESAYQWRRFKAEEYARLNILLHPVDEQKLKSQDPTPPRSECVSREVLRKYFDPKRFYHTVEVMANQTALFGYERWSDASAF